MRRKRHRKNSKKCIILSSIFLLFVFSVGYSAFSSEFLISGKGTIIEKGTISIGGVNVKTVTTGSGLYESEYEEGRYIYRGASPDNYLTLGEDEYRIISKETDGTLKVIKSVSNVSVPFDNDNRGSSDSSDYCGLANCKVWGSRSTMLDSNGNNITTMPKEIGGTEYNLPDTEAYINTYLNTTWYNSLSSTVQNVITTHLFNVGLVDEEETNIINTLSTEKSYKWSGKIGLLNVSDYVLVNTNESCFNGVSGYYSNSTCKNTNKTDNWLYKDIIKNARDSSSWLISPISFSYTGIVLIVFSGGLSKEMAIDKLVTFPVFYLKSDIKLKGTGKSTDQFTLIES